ncbi:MAG: SURF1 family protein [marine benthic group bacterium]|nr:SURF1 family protein [Gemmatimonadota bacterium]
MRSVSRWLPFAIALPLFGLFSALGVWQLQRLGERRAANESLNARFARPVVDLVEDYVRDTASASGLTGRRVRVTGQWAPDGELVVRGQFFMGTPGVTVLTPLEMDSGQAVLVLRGWLPAADGLAADLPLAAIGDSEPSVTVEGLALDGQLPSGLPVREAAYPDRVRPVLGTIDIAAADSILPWSLVPFYIQFTPDSSARATLAPGQPLPLPPPPLTDGPHALYAFQWFGFAAIALAAAFLLPKAARQATVEQVVRRDLTKLSECPAEVDSRTEYGAER